MTDERVPGDPETPRPEEPGLDAELVDAPGETSVAPSPTTPARPSLARQAAVFGRGLLVPFLAVTTAVLVGALVILFSDPQNVATIPNDPLGALQRGLKQVADAYAALLRGSVFNPDEVSRAAATGDLGRVAHEALEPLSFTLRAATPLIFTGLAVALGFRAGLFNIGAEGQLHIAALFAVFVGFSFAGLPFFIHIPLGIAAGFLGGALWGFIPGFLKARTGAHEVIVTIMLNYISYQVVNLMLRSDLFQRPDRDDPISKPVSESAALPQLIPGLSGVHWGFVIALLAAVAVSWLLFRSTKGYEFRAVGLNPGAARYAGIRTGRTIILAMVVSGGLAGLAGTAEVLGSIGRLSPGFSPGYGFDAIALALLGRSKPMGVVAAAILFGALRAGATPMQAATQIPIDIVVVVQALVIMFVAAPALVRGIYRIRSERVTGTEVFSKGWGT